MLLFMALSRSQAHRELYKFPPIMGCTGTVFYLPNLTRFMLPVQIFTRPLPPPLHLVSMCHLTMV